MSDLPTSSFVFLSYSRADSDFALRLKQDLQKQEIPVWMDQEGIPAATPDWEESIRTAIRSCCVVLFIASPDARRSSYVRDELAIAEMYQRPVHPVWAAGEQWMEATPLGFGRMQYIDARGVKYATALPNIKSRLQEILSSVSTHSLTKPNLDFIPRNPYKGLHAFTGKDTRDFFGREKLVDDLADTLKTSLVAEKKGGPSARILAILGPSGSGKSSVMMAALLPGLQMGRVLNSKEWVYLEPVVPGAHPLEALEIALARELPNRSIKEIHDELGDGTSRGLHRFASLLVESPEAKVVLPIDQFEELFMHSVDEKERQRFIDMLITAVTEPRGPVTLLLTLRANFYDRLMHYGHLYQLIQTHQMPVLPMEQSDLRAIIEKPAQLHDVQMTFEGDLIGDLLFEMRGQVGALPLLEFTLDQLFQHRTHHRLTLKAYQELGGVQGALTHHLEATYHGLPSEKHRQLARSLFLRLVDPGKTDQDIISRRATLSEFSLADPTQTEILQETIDAFIAARLITSNENAGITYLEVSHEAVIHNWPRLQEWFNQSRSDIILQLTISRDVEEWERRGKPKDRLYRSSQLKDARMWAEHNTVSEKELAFLRASATRRIQSLVSLLLVVLVLASSMGITGWYVFFQPKPTLVTTLQDNIVGSLRWCINNASSGNTIRFAQGLKGTIKLTGGDLTVGGNKQLTIVGPGANRLTISGGDINANIHVPSGATLHIYNLSFKNTETRVNAFFFNEGILTLTNSVISNNKTIGQVAAYGGGIFNLGILALTDSIVSNNSTSGDSYQGTGGGIYNEGKLTVVNSTFSNNSASSSSQDAFGGGIGNGKTGTLIVINSKFSGNSASSHRYSRGGGISNGGKLTVTGSTFTNNLANGNDLYGLGGGIDNDKTGTLIVTNSKFSGNSAIGKQEGAGGGIDNYEGQLIVGNSIFSSNTSNSDVNGLGGGIDNIGGITVTNSTFSDNSASGKQASQGGGIDNEGQLAVTGSIFLNNSANIGGGISNTNNGSIMVTNSTFTDNLASGKQFGGGGGIYTAGQLTATNSTFSGNSASGKQQGGGGGIENAGKLLVVNSTFLKNTAFGSNGSLGFGGGIANFSTVVVDASTFSDNSAIGNKNSQGGGIDNLGTLILTNSIIAANNAPYGPDIYRALTSVGHNLLTNVAGVSGLSSTDKQVTLDDLKLDSMLGNNGGSTQTLKLLPGSVAIDVVPLQACRVTVTDPVSGQEMVITTDQRGDPRPDGSEQFCDIGAYEYQN